jgi:hypothetical protein
MAKRVDPLKAKKAKQKKVAIGLCVLLAAVVAFQGPKMLKMMKGPQAAAVAEPATPVATPTPTAAVPGATVAASPTGVPVVPGQEAVLADSDVAPDAQSGQLLSIDSFSTKDPFAQQVTEVVPSDNPAPASDSAPPATDSPPDSGAPAGTFDPLGSNPQDQDPNAPPVSTTPSVDPPATATETTISINGSTESVVTLAKFPAADPVFVLESLAKDGKSVEISVAGGSYSNGKQTIKLQIGKRLTLQNTSDGSRYDLELLTVAGFVPPKK